MFQDDTVQQLLKEIDGIREKFFLANNRTQKRELEEQEEDHRKELEKELERQRTEWIENQQAEIERRIAQLPNPEQREQLQAKEQKTFERRKQEFDAEFENARKIVRWKPYDQNAKTDWFKPERMFGIRGGVDSGTWKSALCPIAKGKWETWETLSRCRFLKPLPVQAISTVCSMKRRVSF